MRPIKKKYFVGTTGEGGEGVASLTVTTQGNNYSQGATISIAASPIGGDTATGTITVWTPQTSPNLSINRTTQAVTSAGTGYLTAPAVTIVKPANVTVTATAFSGNLAGNILTVSDTTGLYVGMHQNHGNLAQTAHILTIWSANGNVEMSRGVTSAFVAGQSFQFGDVGRNGVITATLYTPDVSANTIQANAWTTNASNGLTSDVNKQEASRQYYVVNSADSNGRVRLVPQGNGNTPTIAAVTAAGGPTQAGECTIEATDSAGGTYWVTKLEGRTATIVSGGTGTPGTQFSDYSQVVWTLDTPTVNVSVQLDNNA